MKARLKGPSDSYPASSAIVEVGTAINDREAMQSAYGWYYEKMKEKYGDWHGFDAQILSTFLNGFIAYYVGS